VKQANLITTRMFLKRSIKENIEEKPTFLKLILAHLLQNHLKLSQIKALFYTQLPL